MLILITDFCYDTECMTHAFPRYFTIAILILLAIALVLWPRSVESAPTIVFATESGEVKFALEIADSPEEQEKGLMNREKIEDTYGMLFIFPREERVSFWMKNTLIPLDMIFMDEDLQIVHIAQNAEPCISKDDSKCPLYSAPSSAKYVLEIRGNLSKEKQIQVGNRAQLHL